MSTEIIQVIQYLLPGFIAAWIFYSLTPHEKENQFERTIQALIATTFIQAIVSAMKALAFCLGETVYSFGTWSSLSNQVIPLLLSIMFGLSISHFYNTDKLHQLLRQIGLTTRTSKPSVWSNVLSRKAGYATLHLKDERRLSGWIHEWPTKVQSEHFAIMWPIWLLDDGTHQRLENVSEVMISAEEVLWIEFLTENGEENGANTQA